MFGFKIGYSSGDQEAFFKDIAKLKPTIFATFPLIFDKIYKSIHLKLKTFPQSI
jgi:long-subunit acyl-CoA synthetase (AMP-forming)